jgi:hypothetical protein
MIQIPISIGELIDKLSILEVKKQNVKDSVKLQHINTEFLLLKKKSEKYLEDIEIKNLYDKLVETNYKLWNIEDRLRIMEKEKRFGGEFIDYARNVYITNDKRFELKNTINSILSSDIREVKEYVNYSE